MTARDDYPFLAESARQWSLTRPNEPAAALDEIDRLRGFPLSMMSILGDVRMTERQWAAIAKLVGYLEPKR